MKRCLLVFALLCITACSAPPTPTLPDIVAPTSEIATVVPFPTLLPTVTVAVIPVEPTAPAVTVTTVPTNTPRAANNPSSAQRFPAPTLLAPHAPANFRDGNDIPFRYASVGKLEANQCYLLHVELAVPNLPRGNRGDEFLDVDNCGDAGPAGKELTFVLYRGRFTNLPNYGTILAQTHELAPETRLLKMTWRMRIVQNNGRAADGVHYNTVALSPDSPVSEFDFQP